jgi:hypothetical protein
MYTVQGNMLCHPTPKEVDREPTVHNKKIMKKVN